MKTSQRGGDFKALPRVATTATLSLLIAISGVPAQAEDKVALTPTAISGHGTSVEEGKAVAAARESGKPQEVLSHRTETSQVFANPSGSFTQNSYVVPQWVRKDNRLVDIDPSLQVARSGALVTKATKMGLAFSGGGAGPLVNMDQNGRGMSWSWPDPLPKPTVEGNEATYAEVLPGIDLKLRAGRSGFSQLLIVKNAAAAANPRLQEVRLKLDSRGVQASTDEHGNMRAVNPAGQVVFAASPGRMWDSSAGPTGTATASAAAKSSAKATPPKDEFEAGSGAKEAVIPTRISAGHLRLTPDAEMLRGKNTVYPVYIDPTVNSVAGVREAWTIAYKKTGDVSYWLGKTWHNSDGTVGTTTARIGYENSTEGTARTFFQMDTNNLWNTNKVILKSTFRIKNVWSWSCSDATSELWLTGPISPATTWANQPGWSRRLAYSQESKGWSSSCPAANLAYDVTDGAKQAAATSWNNITLGMKVPDRDEDNVNAWKKFDVNTAMLTTDYNTVPNTPSKPQTSPNTGDDCGVNTPYTEIGNTDITLRAGIKDPDGGTVKGRFVLWPMGYGEPGTKAELTVDVTSGTQASFPLSRTRLKDLLTNVGITTTGTFSWIVRAEDGALNSAWTDTCHFRFDATRPSNPPGISSKVFPDGADGWPVGTGSVRTKGRFTFSASGIKDVAKYEYWSDWDPDRKTVKPDAEGGTAYADLTPTKAGSHYVYARSYDDAGNRSDIAAYLFYVNGPAAKDKPGDINGDSIGDLWGTDKDGKLHRFYGVADGSLVEATTLASEADWSADKITHRDDWTDDGFVDLVALRKDSATSTHRLWLHPNTGWGFACSNCSDSDYDKKELKLRISSNNHWSKGAKQILAVGDIDGPTYVDDDNIPDIPGYPDLLVNDGTHVWLYYGSPSFYMDDRDPILLAGSSDTPISSGSSTVADVTFGAPGDWNRDGILDLLVRYDRTDIGGALWVFNGRKDSAGDYALSLNSRTKVGPDNWSVEDVPQFVSVPDLTYNGRFDLWLTTKGSGRIRFWADWSADGETSRMTASEAFSGYQTIG
ncbi:VCBS repeat-containing protein [Streptomyces sp. NPDC101132]|uniref:VCBS repeat-containing protein n=1 Tax=Streptomyces sp. NPDC101132 TaxID=3366110 RepID=UPI00381FC0FE